MKARDFIRPGEHVLVIFTHGGLFEVHPDHSGSTGNWAIDRDRAIDRVIIYHQDKLEDKNVVYIGTFVQADPIDEERRSSIRLNHIQYVGVTDLNWLQFAEGGQNPIRYLP